VRRLEYLRFASLAGRRSVAQHEEIVAACAAGDVTRAGALVEANWLSLGEQLLRAPPRRQPHPVEG